MAVKQMYRYECDRCGAVRTTEDGKLPKDWNLVSFKTMNTFDSGFVTDYELCSDCGIAFGEALKDFINCNENERLSYDND